MTENLEKELVRLVERVNVEAEGTPAWEKIVNSSFVVTLLGGLIITVITTMLQRSYEESRTELQRAERLEERQYQTMVTFADGMTKYLQVAPEAFLRKFFIAKNAKNKDKSDLSFTDERGWSETIVKWEERMEALNKLQSPDSLCSQVSVMFINQDLLVEIRTFDELMDRYAATFDKEEFEGLQKEAVIGYQDVIELMRKELRP